jgi:hypothetical protein
MEVIDPRLMSVLKFPRHWMIIPVLWSVGSPHDYHGKHEIVSVVRNTLRPKFWLANR